MQRSTRFRPRHLTALASTYVADLSHLSRVLTAILLLVLGACEPGDEPAEGSAATVTPIESPAGPESGEPFLSSSEDGVWMSWLQAAPDGGHRLMLSRLAAGSWATPTVVAESERFFVNWADFPSVTTDATGALWAHWLLRGDAGGYDYGVRVSRSIDGGASWSEPWTPHEDGTPQEHGFVTLLPMEDGVGVVWLDGREYSDGPDGSPASREMTLRFRTAGALGAGSETLLDGRTCDCCQTDAAMTSQGPVVTYRDRSMDEIRDIYVTRRVAGEWTEGRAVHDDGWHIEGCPVNGPAIVAEGDNVAIAWFTAANEEPRVKVAFSTDAGATFSEPVVVDSGDPSGRVDLLRSPDGSVVVSWLERTGGEGAEVRVRRVWPEGRIGPESAVAVSSGARSSGFPRMASIDDHALLFAWTDLGSGPSPMISTAVVEVPQ